MRTKARGIAELNGKVAVTGHTKSTAQFTFLGPSGAFVDDTYGTEFMHNFGGADGTCFISVFDPGGVLLWNTLFGPKGTLQPANIDFDNAGNIYVAGTAYWIIGQEPLPVVFTTAPTYNSFPICGGGYTQSAMNQAATMPGIDFWSDGFIAKFNTQYQLERSTLFGGSSYYDHIVDMEVDRQQGTQYVQQ
ncbi:MAG: SBBP repeat-containing protein [Flavobacteriales bacterium]|nr:SBBP repeat-containing protein [Flavobacteriales bacterium]